MRLMSSAAGELPDGLFRKIARYRYKVFVELLGWPLQNRDGVELDQFDRPDTLYVVALDHNDSVIGCARLLPTTHPYLLGEKFPQLLDGLKPPCSPDIWELSRFAVVNFNGPAISALKQFSSPISISLLHESMACAASHGAKRLITVSPIGVERLLQNIGVNAYRAGPPMIVDGQPVVGCWIEIGKDGALRAGIERTAMKAHRKGSGSGTKCEAPRLSIRPNA